MPERRLYTVKRGYGRREDGDPGPSLALARLQTREAEEEPKEHRND